MGWLGVSRLGKNLGSGSILLLTSIFTQ
jgi:hypothetical protein